jgi:hypothetical protein
MSAGAVPATEEPTRSTFVRTSSKGVVMSRRAQHIDEVPVGGKAAF